MKTVVFVSEKGGVGKTRLSDELYYYYTRQNVPTSLYSFDGQYKNRNNDKKVDNPTVAVVDTPDASWMIRLYRPSKVLMWL